MFFYSTNIMKVKVADSLGQCRLKRSFLYDTHSVELFSTGRSTQLNLSHLISVDCLFFLFRKIMHSMVPILHRVILGFILNINGKLWRLENTFFPDNCNFFCCNWKLSWLPSLSCAVAQLQSSNSVSSLAAFNLLPIRGQVEMWAGRNGRSPF